MSAPLATAFAPDWRRVGLLLVPVVGLVVLMYGSTFAAMSNVWLNSQAFAHGLVVGPIAAWLVWRQRERLLALAPRPAPWLALPMLGAAALWLLADMAGVNAGAQIAATAMVVIAIVMLLGTAIGRAIAFPLGFLFFMVPFGDFLVPQLMTWTADVTVMALRSLGVPVYREGLQFVVPTGTWSVIEACSGVRYLTVSVMVGFLFAYLNYSSVGKRAVFIACAVLVSLVANWVRAILLVMVGHLSENRLGAGPDHFFYGWVVYGIVIALIFWIGGRFADPDEAPRRAAPPQAGAPVSTFAWVATAALALAAAAAPTLAPATSLGVEAGPVQLRLPALGEETVAPDLPRPEFIGAAASTERAYLIPGGEAALVHVAYYRQQQYGRKLISSQNVLVKSTSHDWALVAEGRRALALAGRGELVVRTAEMRGGTLAAGLDARRVQVRQVYWVDGELLADDRRAALRGLWGRLLGRGDDAAAVTFYLASADPDSPALDGFVAQHLGAIVGVLEGVRAERRDPS
ncbi:MAG: exosortase A [Rubrivivax sp.]|nr:exosortase A [Rubrivivax sp.]